MEETKEAVKRRAKKVAKHVIRILLPVFLIIAIIIVLLAAVTYFLTIDDGTYKEDDWSSTPYGAAQYTTSVSVNSDGTLSSGTSTQEIWDTMLENGGRVDEYLDSSEELARLMKAEIVTQYPDTRSNPNEDINWDDIVNSNTLQGIIKFKRANSDDNTSTMSYVDPETFQSYIDEYNSNGSETAKQNALSHFTIKTVANNNLSTSTTPDTLDSSSTTPTETGEAKIDNTYNLNDGGYASIFTSGTTGRQYKEYKQNINGWDSRYPISHLANSEGWTSECGVVSVMIVGSGYTENATFEDATQKMEGSNGSSQLATWLSEYTGQSSNFLGSMTTKEEFANKLADGCVAVVHSSDSRVTSSGTHFMAVLDISSDKTQVYLSNPWNNDSMNGWLSIDTVYSLLDNIAFVTNDGSSVDYGSGGTTSGTGDSAANTVVVATWKQVDTTVTTNDPNVQAKNETQYTMTTTNINYEEMVEPYTMPFDMLWALLVEGEDKDFVFELADLVYGSDIQITVYDNLTVNTDVDDWHYTQRTKALVNATITATCNEESETEKITNDEHDPHSETNYQTTKTVVTQTNTINAVLTKANVWIVDYQNDYTYVAPTETSTPSTITKPNEDYPSSPDSTGNSYSCQEIDDERNRLKSIVQERAEQNNTSSESSGQSDSYDPTAPLEPNIQNYIVTFNENINVQYYNKYINITDNKTNTISTQKYIQGTPSVKEKTDKNSSEDNFVTIFNKDEYKKNKSNILNTTSWFFEIIENNESTANMVDLMKYLFYKATGRDYGVTEFEFSIYDATKFSSIGDIQGGNIQEKVWYTLRKAGFSEYATAGAMGNIEVESGFNPESVEWRLF